MGKVTTTTSKNHNNNPRFRRYYDRATYHGVLIVFIILIAICLFYYILHQVGKLAELKQPSNHLAFSINNVTHPIQINDKKEVTKIETDRKKIHDEKDIHLTKDKSSLYNRCFDDNDDDNDGYDMNRSSSNQSHDQHHFAASQSCRCPDPTQSTFRAGKQWHQHHHGLVQYANTISSSTPSYDVIFIGDSILEFWNGTYLGTPIAPWTDARLSFEHYFVTSTSSSSSSSSSLLHSARATTATIRADILASSGDTTTDLLGQLQDGLLPIHLQPKAWMMMIGTNNLGVTNCSKRTTLHGILHVANYLHHQRPNAKIIIHGLLPRGGSGTGRLKSDESRYQLGKYWNQIIWINRHLQQYAIEHEQFHYIDNSDMFLVQIGGSISTVNTHTTSIWAINSTMMKDALHPTVEGYWLLSQSLSSQLDLILLQ
jgi:lysophospholipase L1-like esterase